MKNPPAITSRALFIVSALCLASCESGDPVADMEMDAPVYGNAKPTTFTMQADGVIRLKDIAVAGKTIRAARKLNKSETEILRLLAQKKFDGFMVTALEELRPKYEKQKVVVRQETARKSRIIKAAAETKAAEVEATAGPGAPAAQVIRQQAATEVAKVAQAEQHAIALIDDAWHKEAVDKIRSNYGTNFAVPVKANGPEAAVAFASVDDKGTARASDTAYALNTAPDALLASASSGKAVVAHQGSQSLLISAQTPF